MGVSFRTVAAATLLLASLGLVVAWFVFTVPPDGAPPAPPLAGPGKNEQAGPGGQAQDDPRFKIVGGVRRRASDVEAPAENPPAADGAEPKEKHPGVSPLVPIDLNPNTKSLAEAIRKKKHPERLSTLIQPAKFDRAAFAANPQAYLDVVEPARVFQVAQPGKDVPQLAKASNGFHEITQGESVKLRVAAPAGAPVTYTSFDLGEFQENRLTSVTVVADAEGIAEATFVGTPGTYSDVSILAGSPVASGQARFVVNVKLP